MKTSSVFRLANEMSIMELLEVFGNDLTVVNAARVSFAKESNEFTGKDARLIEYLAKHNHVSPFFHPQVRLRIRMPIFVAREWYRHQIGFARNEVSRRYVSDIPCLWLPDVDDFREKDPNLKQGSKDVSVGKSEQLRDLVDGFYENSLKMYKTLIDNGVAPEIARIVLPQSMYTEFIETGSLAAYARLYKLRNSPDAQKEIRNYANMLGEIMSNAFPVSWKALTSFE